MNKLTPSVLFVCEILLFKYQCPRKNVEVTCKFKMPHTKLKYRLCKNRFHDAWGLAINFSLCTNVFKIFIDSNSLILCLLENIILIKINLCKYGIQYENKFTFKQKLEHLSHISNSNDFILFYLMFSQSICVHLSMYIFLKLWICYQF